jgi:hypothetical protein
MKYLIQKYTDIEFVDKFPQLRTLHRYFVKTYLKSKSKDSGLFSIESWNQVEAVMKVRN